jgi:hypothetical protein
MKLRGDRADGCALAGVLALTSSHRRVVDERLGNPTIPLSRSRIGDQAQVLCKEFLGVTMGADKATESFFQERRSITFSVVEYHVDDVLFLKRRNQPFLTKPLAIEFTVGQMTATWDIGKVLRDSDDLSHWDFSTSRPWQPRILQWQCISLGLILLTGPR